MPIRSSSWCPPPRQPVMTRFPYANPNKLPRYSKTGATNFPHVSAWNMMTSTIRKWNDSPRHSEALPQPTQAVCCARQG